MIPESQMFTSPVLLIAALNLTTPIYLNVWNKCLKYDFLVFSIWFLIALP